MTGKSRNLKIACLCELIIGLVLAICGIVSLVQAPSAAGGAACADGVVLTVLGARCSMLANVPSNASKLFKLALAAFIIGICAAAYCAASGDGSMLNTVLACVEAVLALVVVLIDHSIVNDQKQA